MGKVHVQVFAGRTSSLQKILGDGIQGFRIVFKELATRVDDNVGLVCGPGLVVVLERIVGKVVEDLQGQEEARARHVLVPIEDGLVHNLDLVGVSSRIGAVTQALLLQVGQLATDLDDAVARPLIDLGEAVSNVVEDVQHHGSVSGTHLVYDEIMVGVVVELVVGDYEVGDGLAVVGGEELGRGVPELAQVVGFLVVEGILEGGVAVAEGLEEGVLGGQGGEVEGLAGREDDDLLGEVAVVRIVQTVWGASSARLLSCAAGAAVVVATFYEVPQQHPDAPRALSAAAQHVRGDEGIALEFLLALVGEGVAPGLPSALSLRLALTHARRRPRRRPRRPRGGGGGGGGGRGGFPAVLLGLRRAGSLRERRRGSSAREALRCAVREELPEELRHRGRVH